MCGKLYLMKAEFEETATRRKEDHCKPDVLVIGDKVVLDGVGVRDGSPG